MDKTTPSGGTEQPKADASANAVAKSTDTPAKSGTEQHVGTGENGAPDTPPDEGQALSPEELLKEATLKPETPEQPTGPKPEERRVHENAKFAAAREEALSRVYAYPNVREAETPEERMTAIKKEISKERPDFRNYLLKQVQKMESQDNSGYSPEEQGEQLSEEEKFERWAAQKADREEFPKLFQELCQKSGIGTTSTFSIEMRKKLIETKNQILADLKVPNHTKALRMAAALLGLQDKDKLTAERKRALAAARTAQPANAEPSTTPKQSVYTQEQLSKLTQPEYNRVMELKDKGKVKIVG